MFSCIVRTVGRIIQAACSIINSTTEGLGRLWYVHLNLADVDRRYVAAFGTIAAALIGSESPADAAAAVASIVIALLLAAARGAGRPIRAPLV